MYSKILHVFPDDLVSGIYVWVMWADGQTQELAIRSADARNVEGR
jgi:hypothetical protein